ncbi:MAG: DUF4335 domain-containing protein [Phormidesmis sp. RL_2_1]|nr:DUF4335 domain-containing protein [Phormidesmis sp. RL_2_1]
MTIRKQYQLPNCSLILDGLSIDPTPGHEEIMSLLVNVECRLSGLERSLNGGYNFFAALVRAVSQYSQEVLSGFAHPQVIEGEPLLVHINPGDGPYHHLVVQPEIADLGESGDGRAIDIKLSAVQLFDLTEAVDQFFADSQTLPELEPSLSPLPRRFVRTDEPLSDRALPAVLGLGSLVAATMAIGLLPVPDVVRREADGSRGDNGAEVASTDVNEATPPGGDGTETSPDSLAAANLSSPLWEKAPRITDEAVVIKLQRQLEKQIAENIEPEAQFTETLNYQVAVNEAGDVVGYQFSNDAALRDVDKTPLPKLARANANAQGLEKDAIAQYQVAFNADSVNVSPWQDGTTIAATPTPSPDPTAEPAPSDTPNAGSSNDSSTADADQPAEDTAAPTNTTAVFTDEPPLTLSSLAEVESLNNQLKRTIVDNRDQPRVGTATTYRVRFNEAGGITGYQPIGPTAASSVDQTPLPKLLKPESDEIPSVDYRVVFTERGVIEVSPWWGWSYYE